jgi:hypothetical protein
MCFKTSLIVELLIPKIQLLVQSCRSEIIVSLSALRGETETEPEYDGESGEVKVSDCEFGLRGQSLAPLLAS